MFIATAAFAQQKPDQIRPIWLDLRDHRTSGFDVGSVGTLAESAKAKGATIGQRFRFAASVVVAFDRKTMNGADCKRLAKDATDLLKVTELSTSPTYCYVVARLGLIIPMSGKMQVQAAKAYYDVKRDGVAANVYARTLLGHPEIGIRGQALPFALEAQSKQPDLVKIRWMVAGSYYFKAMATKEKQYWQASVAEYEKALSLAASGKDKDFSKEDLELMKFYLKRAKEELAKSKS
jgi:hypothetical protein